jgi:hypothetical protein
MQFFNVKIVRCLSGGHYRTTIFPESLFQTMFKEHEKKLKLFFIEVLQLDSSFRILLEIWCRMTLSVLYLHTPEVRHAIILLRYNYAAGHSYLFCMVHMQCQLTELISAMYWAILANTPLTIYILYIRINNGRSSYCTWKKITSQATCGHPSHQRHIHNTSFISSQTGTTVT